MEINNMPIQPTGSKGIRGYIEIYPIYSKALKDLNGFSHIILIYHFHKQEGYSLTVTPFLDTKQHGIFATRAPKRPNPIGFSVVNLLKIEGLRLDIENVDILNKTPLLDIKPFVPKFDCPSDPSIGWLTGKIGNLDDTLSDSRFK
jgi:tRNA-Thr(GGU) m(6)t(6)A37 methyltransferase TsaA